MATKATDGPVLEIENLTVTTGVGRRRVTLVGGVDLQVDQGQTLAVVGESGSGKSMTVLAASGLTPAGITVTGSVRLLGEELLTLPRKQLRRTRARRIGFVFQDPLSSLNPLMPVGRQVGEACRSQLGMTKAQAHDRAVELLDLVGIPRAADRAGAFPHEFSGGMRQRVMIAMALACDPSVLIADEPTTALDVTMQAQIIEVVRELQGRLGTAVVWITHDLGVVAGNADAVAVMYGGRIIEHGPVDDLFARPSHPYTRGLLAARPRLGERVDVLPSIPGAPPTPAQLPAGCAFHARCPVRSDDRCRTELPPLVEVAPGHRVRSFYAQGAS